MTINERFKDLGLKYFSASGNLRLVEGDASLGVVSISAWTNELHELKVEVSDPCKDLPTVTVSTLLRGSKTAQIIRKMISVDFAEGRSE